MRGGKARRGELLKASTVRVQGGRSENLPGISSLRGWLAAAGECWRSLTFGEGLVAVVVRWVVEFATFVRAAGGGLGDPVAHRHDFFVCRVRFVSLQEKNTNRK